MAMNFTLDEELNKLMEERDNASQVLQRIISEYDAKIAERYNQVCNAEDILGKLICYSMYISDKTSSGHLDESWYSWVTQNNNDPHKAVKALFDHNNHNVIKLKFNVPTSTKFLEYNQCFEYRGKSLDITLTLDERSKEYYCTQLEFSETYSKYVYYSKVDDKPLDYYFNCNKDILVLVNDLLLELNDGGDGMLSNLINKLYSL